AHVYAIALLGMEQLRLATPPLALAAGGGSLIGRVQRLMVPAQVETFPRWMAGLVVAALVVTIGAGTTLAARTEAVDAGAEVPARTRMTLPSCSATPRGPTGGRCRRGRT